MARHSNGKNNYALSKGAIAFLVLLALMMLAVAAAGVVWGTHRGKAGGNQAAPECVSGELALPVAASSEGVAREVINAYANSQPVVRDYCVQPVYVDNLSEAAVYIAPNTPISHQEIAHAQRSATTNEPASVYSSVVGLAGPNEIDPATVDIKQVDFPTDEQPEASAVVASAVADNDNAAVAALTEQRVGTAASDTANSTRFVASDESNVPDGFTFSPLADTSVVYSAIPLNTTDAVTEDQTRAAQAFADFASEQYGNDSQLPVVAESVWAAARPNGGERISTAAQEHEPAQTEIGEPIDTLFLLDTSDQMAHFAEPVAQSIGAVATSLTDAGRQVALWNYSSPLNPGVTQSFRRNVEFTNDGAQIGAAAQGFINAGAPRTREAVAAALKYAESVETPIRVMLITSGTVDDADVTPAIAHARAAGVELSVVHVGAAPKDQVLIDAATSSTDLSSPVDSAIREAVGL
ncbi:VWA domain-containing protein [Corynebacterium genitalium ATCC 33030]|uniref:von Willebrand factor type A domain protein n=1 Tax=Corynebacterium genitalium ATCC 33030 TaxID=585529 RepID=D7WCW0_9CORY|nr:MULTISPECIES: vWA domain-containing protein [Corynebacterium]EFK53991.1 von Willebrand factor type A domain protein [Corynebacterium genitalium ATCC 33030]MCQ4627194.1 VWA domain-containing protein [Corynebacterium sp. CCUG 65737]UUA88468.1 VWA domain-containing protein [Corynebacterium genitalium ATCC 33030]